MIGFGVIVGLSLVLQAIVPITALILHKFGLEQLAIPLNENFKLPMDVITTFWAACCAAYVGVDRAAFTIQTFINKEGTHINGEPEHLKQVIIESFIVYSIGVLLNVFFNADFALSPLFTAFGSSLVLYIGGSKAITGVKGISKHDDLDQDGINDSEQDPAEVLKRVKVLLGGDEDDNTNK